MPNMGFGESLERGGEESIPSPPQVVSESGDGTVARYSLILYQAYSAITTPSYLSAPTGCTTKPLTDEEKRRGVLLCITHSRTRSS